MVAIIPSSDPGDAAAGLSPVQADCLEKLLAYAAINNLVILCGAAGSGKTTILHRAHKQLGGEMLTAQNLVEAMQTRDPFAIEETFYTLVLDALGKSDVVFVDDLDLLFNVVTGCHFYQRAQFIELALKALADHANSARKKLIFATDGQAGVCLRPRSYFATIESFAPADYAALCRVFLGEKASQLDFAKIFRFAPKLDVHQLKEACAWLIFKKQINTGFFIEYLRSTRMASNVHLDEVARVEFSDLKGIDDILQALEANIILPLENDALAQELHIKPKRGVLIAGPPGTGKTTIGRALAHRLRGKFFLIDGTFISGTQNFYAGIHRVFESAKENSPSIIFIDDSDVIFESGEEHGLYRYLLTMLDGLESESNARVCVMMTAMDVGNLPPALIRSGRVELWLETRLPDAVGRTQILQSAISQLPAAMGAIEIEPIAQATEGLTGADVRRLIEDGKILFAYDRSRGLPLKSATDYFLAAVETVRLNKERYARAESQARLQRKTATRPPWFDVHVASDSFVQGE